MGDSRMVECRAVFQSNSRLLLIFYYGAVSSKYQTL